MKQKMINKLKESLEDCPENITEKTKNWLSIEQATRLISRYMPMQVYMDKLGSLCTVKTVRDRVCTIHEMIDDVFNYKMAVAKKNGRILKDDPRKKAMIDLSDSFTRYVELGKESMKTVGKMMSVQTNQGRCFNLQFKFDGFVCLPFKHCIIYTPSLVGDAQVVDITDCQDGTYKGTLWACLPHDRLMQNTFKIERMKDEFQWTVTISMPCDLKPLGGSASNLINLFSQMITKSQEQVDEMEKIGSGDPALGAWACIVTGLNFTLKYLSSYRSKVVYQLKKDDTTMYVYADKAGENAENYLKKEYPDWKYERLNSWLIDGYWEFKSSNFVGADQNGKIKKGMTWITPYEKVNKQVAESNGQHSNLVPIHALERAKERYNLDLSIEDLDNILEDCLKGNATKLSVRNKFGKVQTTKGKIGCYRIKYKNTYMDVALAHGLERKSARVATFLPKPKDINFNIIDNRELNEILKDCVSS